MTEHKRPTLPERDLKIGDKSFKLVFSFRAIAALEEAYDLPIKKIAARMQSAEDVRIVDLRNLLWAAMREHHPDMTLDDVFDVLNGFLTEQGDLGEIMNTTFAAFNAAGE